MLLKTMFLDILPECVKLPLGTPTLHLGKPGITFHLIQSPPNRALMYRSQPFVFILTTATGSQIKFRFQALAYPSLAAAGI